MRTRGEAIAVQLNEGQAVDARDALAKALYARLFDWLVSAINTSTSRKRDVVKEGIISLLDIFGFEVSQATPCHRLAMIHALISYPTPLQTSPQCFVTNRFEQLCINFANEKLQQKFTQDVFKTVQIEYEEEGITWDHIEFPDNADMYVRDEFSVGVRARGRGWVQPLPQFKLVFRLTTCSSPSSFSSLTLILLSTSTFPLIWL
jgi:myosin V